MSEPPDAVRRWWMPPEGARANRLADAFLQDHLMAPRIGDREREQEEEPWRFFYAVGADVVMLYADPDGHARAGHDRAIGYGEIFRSDTMAQKSAIALVLARFLWYGLGDATSTDAVADTRDPPRRPPLLLLPQVDTQLGLIVKALHDSLTVPISDKRTQRSIRDISAALAKSGAKPTDADLELLQKAGLLAGPAASLRRIRELFESGRLRSADAPGTTALLPAPLARALEPPRRVEEIQSLRLLTEMWAPAIREARSSDSARGQDRDSGQSHALHARKSFEIAEAMARLEIVNRRLAAAGERIRLLYITGDTSVFRVAARHSPSDLPHEHCPDQLERPSFADAYLRHPRAFLDEPQALRATRLSPEDATLEDILTMELGQFRAAKERFAGRETSHFLVAKASRVRISMDTQARILELEKNDSNGLQLAVERWRRLTQRAEALLPPPSFFAELDRLARGPQAFTLRQKFDERRKQIDAELRAAVNDLFDTVVFARMLLQFPGDPPPREPPYFVLEKRDSPVTEFILDAERRWREHRPFTSREYRDFRDQVERQSGARYFLNLANGWLLAAQGHWTSASKLAEIAVQAGAWHSPSERPEGDAPPALEPIGPNGREARYLLATCLRHVARTEGELARCDTLLAELRCIANQESDEARRSQIAARELGQGAEDDPWLPDIVPERFAAEQRSLEIARAHFTWHRARTTGVGEQIGRARDKLLGLVETIEGDDVPLLSNALKDKPADEEGRARRRGGSIPDDMPSIERRQEVRRQLLHRAQRHCIGIELLVGEGRSLESVAPWLRVWPSGAEPHPVAIWRRIWQQDETFRKAPPSNGLTELQDLCGIAMHAGAAAKRGKALEDLRQLRNLLSSSTITAADNVAFDLRRILVHSYDRERFRTWITHVIEVAGRRRSV